jgi:uncharacterized membrane protein YozB (DUF420 family)
VSGFLGTGASFQADINLSIQVLMGVALIAGMFLPRRGSYRAHAVCQGCVVLLNLVMVLWLMLPSFRWGVLPGLPESMAKPYYSVATLHAALGGIAELVGLYVLLRAGTNLLPTKLRFQNYRIWMRVTLALWWAALPVGVATYYVWL